MYTNKAYLNNSLIDIKDKTKPLIVTSCGTYNSILVLFFIPCVPKVALIFNYFILYPAKPIFTLMEKKRLFMPGIWYSTARKNRSNTSITQKIRPKYTGFILLAVMLPICSVLMDLQTIKKFFPAVPIWNTNNFFVR